MLMVGSIDRNEIGGRYTGPLLQDAVITAVFGRTDDVHTVPHSGVDFASTTNNRVQSPVTGKVVFRADDGDGNAMSSYFGNCIIIDCGDDERYLLGHFASLAVNVGDGVEAGPTYLGEQGSTGQSTGNHVHVGYARTSINPWFLKEPNGGTLHLMDAAAPIVIGIEAQ